MGIVFWHVTMSLDGFTAGPDGATERVFRFPEPNPMVDEVISSIGVILAGRHSFDVGANADQRREASKPYGGRRSCSG